MTRSAQSAPLNHGFPDAFFPNGKQSSARPNTGKGAMETNEPESPPQNPQISVMGRTVDATKLKLFLDLMDGMTVTPATGGGSVVPPPSPRTNKVTPINLEGAMDVVGTSKEAAKKTRSVVHISPSPKRGRTRSPRHQAGHQGRSPTYHSRRSPSRHSRRSPSYRSRSPTLRGGGYRTPSPRRNERRGRSPPVIRQVVRQPLSDYILAVPVPAKMKLPAFTYKGDSDPNDHTEAFESFMALWEQPDEVWCRVFPTTLHGMAQNWYKSLPSGSVYCYSDLRESFIAQYACN